MQYDPDPEFLGEDSFTYTANGGTEDSNIATVTVTVIGVVIQRPPAAFNDGAEVRTGEAVAINVLANDIDIEQDPLTVTNLTQPADGAVTLDQDGTVRYTPDAGFLGTDTFTYTANDGTEDSNVATVTVTVLPTRQQPPVAVDDAVTIARNSSRQIGVLDNDFDPNDDPLTVTNLTQPDFGTVELLPNDRVLYSPAFDFTGVDTFTYTANDGVEDSNPGTVTVNVVRLEVASGEDLAESAEVNATTTGEALAESAEQNATTTGEVLANAAARNARSTGAALAIAARANAAATGDALANAIATGEALARSARRNPGATGAALLSS